MKNKNMKNNNSQIEVKIGSSIKVEINNKEQFLTVESFGGEIGLFKGSRLITTRVRKNDVFKYQSKSYIVKG